MSTSVLRRDARLVWSLWNPVRAMNGLGYYKEVKDASTNYFFERLPKGTYVIEAECYVERAGRYALGAVKLNGVYAPEFSAYGAGTVLEVSE